MNNKPFQMQVFAGGLWFRVFGYGLAILDKRLYPPLFSQRSATSKTKTFWHLKITPLTP